MTPICSNGGGNFDSTNAVMTPDGRYVAFVSLASNLVSGDTNNAYDVFVRDLVARKTTVVSVNNSGVIAGVGCMPGHCAATDPSIAFVAIPRPD